MRFLNLFARGGRCDVSKKVYTHGGHGAIGLRGLVVCARCCTLLALDVRHGGGRCSAPPSRSEGKLLTRRPSSPRKIVSITVELIVVQTATARRASTNNEGRQ